MNYDIVIRCFNEAHWLEQTNEAINLQKSRPNKVVFVDSGSDDGSVKLAEKFNWQLIKYEEKPFKYSKSLNIGLSNSESDLVMILSAHCILFRELSASYMINEFKNKNVGAVFGRQLPTNKSTPHDVRDLLTVFGRERLVYSTCPFFHNAFSMIRKDCWKIKNFDEKVNGIEDRIWAREIAQLGYKVIYQPNAAAYHEHGLNHGTSKKRAERVVQALKVLHQDDYITWPED
tara:strand:+ start:2984 stop:3676 length:693 start_codon:yes stop_codon:yes gene_type:complete